MQEELAVVLNHHFYSLVGNVEAIESGVKISQFMLCRADKATYGCHPVVGLVHRGHNAIEWGCILAQTILDPGPFFSLHTDVKVSGS